jgi:hypothetical protein
MTMTKAREGEGREGEDPLPVKARPVVQSVCRLCAVGVQMYRCADDRAAALQGSGLQGAHTITDRLIIPLE